MFVFLLVTYVRIHILTVPVLGGLIRGANSQGVPGLCAAALQYTRQRGQTGRPFVGAGLEADHAQHARGERGGGRGGHTFCGSKP